MSTTIVDRYDIFEAVYQTSDTYDNPYVSIEATATCTRPDGAVWTMPLFYDGDGAWGLRISPDRVGDWMGHVESSDTGLNGATFRFTCVGSDRRGGLQSMAGHPYHFQRQDGTPVWLMGDTNWRLFATDAENNVNRETVQHYIDVRAGQGFNYIHADVMGGAGIDSQQTIFRDFPNEIIAPAFFQEMDARVRYLNDKGITAGIVLAWHKGPKAWDAFASDEARLRYARYIVARYSAFDVIFIISGEWDQIKAERKPTFNRIGQEIMRMDPHGRLRGIHPCQRRTVEEFAEEEWMSFGDYQQMYEAPHDREATAAERDALRTRLLKTRVHAKPVLNTEYAYYLREMDGNQDYKNIGGLDNPHSHTRASFRRASWVLTMAGGYFVTGFGTTYFGGWRDKGPFDVDAAKNDDAESDLTNIGRFWRALDWWTLDPHDELVQTGDGGLCYCLANPGSTYVVYSEGNRSVRLDLGDGNYTVRCYDPRTGTYASGDEHSRSDAVDLETSDTQDWVFLVTRG